jgi:muramoyltetrapeptide carboxypeptidase
MGLTIYEDVCRLAADFSFPLCFNAPVGHVDRNVPLVEGARAELRVDADGVALSYLQSE